MKKIFTQIEKLKKENDFSNLKKISELMNEKEVREKIEFFLSLPSKEFSSEEIKETEFLVNIARYLYENSGEDTGMSDSEYDILFDKLSTLGVPFSISSSVSKGGGDIVHHKYRSLRGTLDKVYALTEDEVLKNDSRKTLDQWIASSERKIEEKTGKKISLNQEEVFCFPKFDGVSVVFQFSSNGKLLKALTRGNTATNEAKDVTHIFRDWVVGPYTNTNKEYGLKTEVMMTNHDFETYNLTQKKPYKQSRSVVSSIINRNETNGGEKYLKIIPLRVSYMDNNEESLQELPPGVFDYPYLRCKLSDRELMKKFAESNRFVNDLRTDGMVIYIINPTIQKILGREDEKQKFEVAYKFTEEKGYSKIKDIEFNLGLYGMIYPVAIIEPIKMKGNEIGRVSLGSYERYLRLGLAKGDKVQILYDIIPYIVFDPEDPKCKRSGKKAIEPPKYCPECGQRLEEGGVKSTTLMCKNPKCSHIIKGKILNYLIKMDIDNISYATVDTLYNEGYLKSIEDIYKLHKKKKDLVKIPGFGKKRVGEFLQEIEDNRSVSYSQFLGALGILGISAKTFQKVFSMLGYEEFLEICMGNEDSAIKVLSVIPGIKEKSATKIVDGIRENIKLITFLEKELDLYEDYENQNYTFRVAFSKVRDDSLEEFIRMHDGKIDDTLTKSTDLLIVPMYGVRSSKVTRAEKYEIPIIGIKDARAFIESHFLK